MKGCGVDLINNFFDRMDSWRHLPSYQLERRADLIFSLYLRQVLQKHTGVELQEQIIPEFPVRIGTIYEDVPIDKSYKIDYVAISSDGKKAFLVELKTEGESRRDSQDKYLLAAQNAGMASLLAGIVQIFKATQAKHKYLCLFDLLELLGQVRMPPSLTGVVREKSAQFQISEADGIEVTSRVESMRVLYIQPNGDGQNVINFKQFAAEIQDNEDVFAARFATSLREWACVPAGQRALI